MILKYNSFQINEANINKNLNRNKLKLGDSVLTDGIVDGLDISNQIGKIIYIREYGSILVEFNDSFSSKLHNGSIEHHGEINRCWFVPITNIITNDISKIKKIKKEQDEYNKHLNKSLSYSYNEGDIIIGIGSVGRININGYIGIIYNILRTGQSLTKVDKNNNVYWVGFYKKFDNKLMSNNIGIPSNMSGIQLDKMNIRPLNEDEKNNFKDEIDYLKQDFKNTLIEYKVGDVIAIRDTEYIKSRLGEIFINRIGIIVRKSKADNKNYVYFIRFNEKFSDYLNNGNYCIDSNKGYSLYNSNFRYITDDEYTKNEYQINANKEEIELYTKEYKIGDLILCKGNVNGFDLNNKIGTIIKIDGHNPQESFIISFFDKFSPYLNKYLKYENCLNIRRNNINPVAGDELIELKRKLDNKEILSYQSNNKLSLLMDKLNFNIKIYFLNMSYFDVGDKNDMISYLPIDKFKRLEEKDDPYTSRFRQHMKIGKFLKMLSNNTLTEKNIEDYVNRYKALYQTYISDLSETLKIVSGEDIRYWYCEDNYVKGGGMLNSSCMRYKNKGPEMQMFVDNPDVIQMLIMVNKDKKLLGRALIWRLAIPHNSTFMDYIYTRYDSDADLFKIYADTNGWFTPDNAPSKMVCILQNNKKYVMGKNALDHFDTLYNLNTEYNYIYRGDVRPDEVKPLINRDGGVYMPFEINTRVIYENSVNKNHGKHGIFMGLNKEGKLKIIFDDGVKLLTTEENVKKEK